MRSCIVFPLPPSFAPVQVLEIWFRLYKAKKSNAIRPGSWPGLNTNLIHLDADHNPNRLLSRLQRVQELQFRFDCVYFVPVDYDSTMAFTWNFLEPRSFDRSCVAKFFRREIFFVAAKIFSSARKFAKKKFGPTRSILSKNRRNRSHPRDF